MKNTLLGHIKYLMLLMLAFAMDAGAASYDTSSQPFVRIPGHVPVQVAGAKSVFMKSLDADQDVAVTFTLPLRNRGELEDLVKRIHDPSDKQHYGKYLSTEEFIERYAPTEEDYNKVIAYARSMGLSVSGTHANRLLLNVKGSAGTVESGLRLSLNQYQLKGGRKFFAPDNDPAVPASIASIIDGVVGLDNLAVWRTYKLHKHGTDEFANSNAGSQAYPSGPGGGFAPNDLVVAYNLAGVSANGSGQNIALFQLASYQDSDINHYASYFGLPAPKLQHILVDGGSGEGIDAEVSLDIELVHALAPEGTIYVYEGPNTGQGVLDTYNRIATDNIAKQVSTSWGLSEDLVGTRYLNAENAIFLQMAAHGQTIYAASGDSGAYDDYPNRKVLVVDDPASQPYVVGVGGTTLNVNPNNCSYISETVWNHGLGNGGGGGVSKVWPIPDWQANVSGIYSTTNRNVPDVALNADTSTGYAIYHDGRWAVYGGTSCAAPLWAGFTARVNQERQAADQPVLGFANPIFYAIGAGASSGSVFHDITSGTNQYYSAKANYDNASGWGSFNGANLFVALTSGEETPPPPPPEPKVSPVFGFSLSHDSDFKRGKTGTYHIAVSNTGDGATSGKVVVDVDLPKGLKYSTQRSPGWTFNKSKLSFTRNDSLAPGESYPVIILTVSVSSNAPVSVTPTASVSGGGAETVAVANPTTTKKKSR